MTRAGLWPPFPLGALSARPVGRCFPLDDSRCRVYSRARQGLWHGVRALGLGAGDEVLVPIYHQGAEIEAFRRAGLTCRFYRLSRELEPLEADLNALLGPRTRGLHLIHYWGFPQLVERWRRWCDERGLALIEDGAQAFLARSEGVSVGARADLAVFCLYKSFGLPDGAAAICRLNLPHPRRPAPVGLRALARRLGSTLTAESPTLARLRATFLRESEEEREEGSFLEGELDLGDPRRPPTAATSWVLSRVVNASAADRRRRNYAFLLDRLHRRVPPPFEVLSDGAVPIGFPIVVENVLSQASELRRERIVAGVLWPTRHPIARSAECERAEFFRRRVLALPVHQELSSDQMERIARAATRLPGHS